MKLPKNRWNLLYWLSLLAVRYFPCITAENLPRFTGVRFTLYRFLTFHTHWKRDGRKEMSRNRVLWKQILDIGNQINTANIERRQTGFGQFMSDVSNATTMERYSSRLQIDLIVSTDGILKLGLKSYYAHSWWTENIFMDEYSKSLETKENLYRQR